MHAMLARLRHVGAAATVAVAAILAIDAAAAQSLPPLPDAIKKQGMLRAGVKCDYPPDGFMDQSGKPVGVEVSLSRQVAAYAFGSPDKIELTCVTTANRIPTLVGGKVDVVIATIGITDERAKVVDFSDRYAWGGSDVLVVADSPLKGLDALKGKTVIAIKGAWQIGWFEKNLPEVNLLKLDTVSDGLQALLQGRGVGYAHDLAVLQGIAAKNQRVKLLGELYQLGYRGAAVRKGESEWLAYVNAAIARAKKEGLVAQWIRQYDQPDLVAATIDSWDITKVPPNAR
ncbi:MAG: transporter substrate-binding domain-containing protein [Alphaproteobacteria bacterium]|nr:transporter substrate-binding domain-containing protein [Alphaproteobacteria bacterium]